MVATIMGYDNYIEDQYEVPFLAKILHSLPHLNITLHRTNNTFRPTDEIYLEVRLHFFLSPMSWFVYKGFFQFQSLGLLGSIPAAALILSLFCLLLYLMSRCCDRKPRPAHSITSLKVTLSIVTVLCCAAIGLGEFKSSIKANFLFSFLIIFLSLTHIKFFFLSRIRYCSLFIRITPPLTHMSFFIFHCRSF
jgi:hypothetical protein